MQTVNVSVLVAAESQMHTHMVTFIWTFCEISLTYSKIIEIGEGLVFRQVHQSFEEEDF